MGNGVSILADDGSRPDRSANVGGPNASRWDNLSIAGDVAALAGDGFTVSGTVSIKSNPAAWGRVVGEPMSAAILEDGDDIEVIQPDMPLDEARRIAGHRQREIEGLLGD